MCKFESTFKVLDNIVALNLDVTLWAGRKKLEAQDLGGVELPPDDLASLGSKRIIDPEKIKVFSTLRSRAASYLDKHGVRFMGGWGVPETKLGGVIDELIKIRGEFETAKATFLADYDKSIEEWINTHSEWASIIRSSTVSSDYVRARLNFKWQAYRVSPVDEHENRTAVLESGLAAEVEGIADTLYSEVAHTAKDMWARVFEGRAEVSQKALSPIRTLREKLAGLTFVEPNVCHVVEVIDGALKRMPDRGVIKGTDLLLLHGLVNLLQDGDALYDHAQQIEAGYGPAFVLDALLQQMTPLPANANVSADSQGDAMKETEHTAAIVQPTVPVVPKSVTVIPPVASPQIPSLGLF